MYIAYYDETGDDGLPGSSPLFALTSIYIHHLKWKEVYQKIHQFRVQLKEDFRLPVKLEFHTKYFLLNKKPYRDLKITEDDRIMVIDLFCNFLATLDIQIVNIAINKPIIQSSKYPVLNNALSYSVQRIENDLTKRDHVERFMIITDEGRLSTMRSITRKIQKINFIPSKFNPTSYRQEIKLLIEDPLAKDSKESYLIQMCDLLGFIVYLYGLSKFKLKFHNRMPSQIDDSKINGWLDSLKGVLNLNATQSDPYGIVFQPTK